MLKKRKDSFVVEFHLFVKIFFIFFSILSLYFFFRELSDGRFYNFKKRGIIDPSFLDYVGCTVAYLLCFVFFPVLANIASQKIKVNYDAIEIQKYFGIYKKKFYRQQIYSSQYIIFNSNIKFIKIKFSDGTQIRIYREEINFIALKEYLSL